MQKLRIKRIEHFRSSKNKQFYLRLIGLNGKTVFNGEGYTKRSGRDNAIAIINQSLVAPVAVVEVPCPSLKKGKAASSKAPVKALKPARALVNQTKSAKVAPKKAKADRKGR